MKTHLALLASGILAVTAHAAPRTSADYTLTAETLDFGGLRTASADYSNDGSVGEIVGISTEATVPMLAKHGYIGQLYDLLGYSLLASDYYPPELGTTQLFPVRSADDGTSVVVSGAGITFSVVSGPLAGISTGGLATAGAVYENTTATVGATSALFAGQLTLPIHIQDTVPDNFGTYAADGLPDGWQQQYFGLDNPLAAPALDPDGDGQTNAFEFTAGLTPTDPASRFLLSIAPILGEPAARALILQPIVAGRSYSIEFRESLTLGDWQPLPGLPASEDAGTRTLMDTAIGQRFYRVRIDQP